MKRKKPLSIWVVLSSGLLTLILAVFINWCWLPVSKAKVDLNSEERGFIEDLNNYRKKNGLSQLKISKNLSDAALAMAEDMAENPDTVNHDHKDSKGRLPSERAVIYGYTDGVGENLAAGYQTANDVFEAWKGSAEHKENMVSRDYEVMGIARVTTGSDYKWYWVNMFGSEAHDNDLVAEEEYKPLVRMSVTVTDEGGTKLNKAKLKVMNKAGSTLASGRTSKKGKKAFTLAPKDEYYVRATLSGYKTYTKKVKPGDKKDLSVKMWLEKN